MEYFVRLISGWQDVFEDHFPGKIIINELTAVWGEREISFHPYYK